MNALHMAHRLKQRPEVRCVHYPGLDNDATAASTNDTNERHLRDSGDRYIIYLLSS